ncbi:hypothetical protein PGT21_026283 [Puccinia graminis f. sp. tritici]|uniref:Uncharacterized protein n=1 Tax=Puccinia graminis f. sp. tritici TaxID=56615 RepID=A0A5B0NQB9_PUCGR|nr:hypothetical protein PGT21_026283 [Puccinia graminis f. sp. tritici]
MNSLLDQTQQFTHIIIPLIEYTLTTSSSMTRSTTTTTKSNDPRRSIDLGEHCLRTDQFG